MDGGIDMLEVPMEVLLRQCLGYIAYLIEIRLSIFYVFVSFYLFLFCYQLELYIVVALML